MWKEKVNETMPTTSMTPLEFMLIDGFGAQEDKHPMRRAIAVAGVEMVADFILMWREARKCPMAFRPNVLCEFIDWIDLWLNDLDDGPSNPSKTSSFEAIKAYRRDAFQAIERKMVPVPSKESRVDSACAYHQVLSDVTATSDDVIMIEHESRYGWTTVCHGRRKKLQLSAEKIVVPRKSARRQQRRRRRRRRGVRRATEVTSVGDPCGESKSSSYMKTVGFQPTVSRIEECAEEIESDDTALVTTTPVFDGELSTVDDCDFESNCDAEIVFEQVETELALMSTWPGDGATAWGVGSSLIGVGNSIDGASDSIVGATSFAMDETIESDLISSILDAEDTTYGRRNPRSGFSSGTSGLRDDKSFAYPIVADVGDSKSSEFHDGSDDAIGIESSLFDEGDNLDLGDLDNPTLGAVRFRSDVLSCLETSGGDDDEPSRCPFIPDASGETLLFDSHVELAKLVAVGAYASSNGVMQAASAREQAGAPKSNAAPMKGVPYLRRLNEVAADPVSDAVVKDIISTGRSTVLSSYHYRGPSRANDNGLLGSSACVLTSVSKSNVIAAASIFGFANDVVMLMSNKSSAFVETKTELALGCDVGMFSTPHCECLLNSSALPQSRDLLVGEILYKRFEVHVIDFGRHGILVGNGTAFRNITVGVPRSVLGRNETDVDVCFGKPSYIFECRATPVPAQGEKFISVVSDKELKKCRTVTKRPICLNSVGSEPVDQVSAQLAPIPWYACNSDGGKSAVVVMSEAIGRQCETIGYRRSEIESVGEIVTIGLRTFNVWEKCLGIYAETKESAGTKIRSDALVPDAATARDDCILAELVTADRELLMNSTVRLLLMESCPERLFGVSIHGGTIGLELPALLKANPIAYFGAARAQVVEHGELQCESTSFGTSLARLIRYGELRCELAPQSKIFVVLSQETTHHEPGMSMPKPCLAIVHAMKPIVHETTLGERAVSDPLPVLCRVFAKETKRVKQVESLCLSESCLAPDHAMGNGEPTIPSMKSEFFHNDSTSLDALQETSKDATVLKSCHKVVLDPNVVEETNVSFAMWKPLHDEVFDPNGETQVKEPLHDHSIVFGHVVKKLKLLPVLPQGSLSCLASIPEVNDGVRFDSGLSKLSRTSLSEKSKLVGLATIHGVMIEVSLMAILKREFVSCAIETTILETTPMLESHVLDDGAAMFQQCKYIVSCVNDTSLEVFACDVLIDTTKLPTSEFVVSDTVERRSQQAVAESKPSVMMKSSADDKVDESQSVTSCGCNTESMRSVKSPRTTKELKLRAFEDVATYQEAVMEPRSYCNGCVYNIIIEWGAEGKIWMPSERTVKESPPQGLSMKFEEESGVMISSSVPYSKMSERWNALSYHRLCDDVVRDCVGVSSMQNKDCLADIATKSVHRAKVWTHYDEMFAQKDDDDLCQDKLLVLVTKYIDAIRAVLEDVDAFPYVGDLLIAKRTRPSTTEDECPGGVTNGSLVPHSMDHAPCRVAEPQSYDWVMATEIGLWYFTSE